MNGQIRINPGVNGETHTGQVRIEMIGPKGRITLKLELEDGFPVIDVHFPDGKGQYFTVNADEQDKCKNIPINKDLCVTLSE